MQRNGAHTIAYRSVCSVLCPPKPLKVLSPQDIPGLAAAPPVAPPSQTSVDPPTQTPTAVPLPTYPTLPPYSGSIPTIPARFATAATSGELVDFNELLHALESEGTEETPVQIELGEEKRLTLPKKRQVSSFIEWGRCFAVYSHYLSSHQPQRSTDLMAYLYLIATCHAEYNISACMANDIAFRRKAARFCLASWGRIDPQLYTKAFTGYRRVHGLLQADFP